mmetsp:Transcript_28234/g.60590  ORF Transcript_28234/g.60590 Transcript_28234/m.60590 type:complete len:236 (+) Transcript_28234:1449-2156(+)
MSLRFDSRQLVHHVIRFCPNRRDSKEVGIGLDGFSQRCSNVEQLFRNAAHVDTGSSESPGRSLRRRFYEITQRNLSAVKSGLLRGGHASRTTTDDDEVVIEAVISLVPVVHHFRFVFHFFHGCRFHKVSAPIQGRIVPSQVFFDVGGIRIAVVWVFGDPYQRASHVVLSFRVAKVVSKAVVDEPLTKLGAVVEFVFDDSQSIGEKEGHARQTFRDAIVKTTRRMSCNMEDFWRGR